MFQSYLETNSVSDIEQQNYIIFPWFSFQN